MNLPTIYQLSTNYLPTICQLSANYLPTIYQLSTNSLPTIYQLSTHYLPTIYQLSTHYLPTICQFLFDTVKSYIVHRPKIINNILIICSLFLTGTEKKNSGSRSRQKFLIRLNPQHWMKLYVYLRAWHSLSQNSCGQSADRQPAATAAEEQQLFDS